MGVNIKKPNPYDTHLTAEPVKAYTQVATKKADEPYKAKEDKEEVISKGLLIDPTELCRVEVAGGMTIKIGDFEFARIDVKLMVPCTKSDMNEAYEFASDWVSEKIGAAVAAAKGEN